MEVDGMYENTPWEHLSLYAPWIGIAVVIAAVILYFWARKREDLDFDGALALQDIARSLAAAGLSVATLGVLFTVMWRPAHDVYPHAFGRAAIGTGIGAAIIGGVIALVRRAWAEPAILYGALTASVCAGAAISAFSHTIIAEGQVTAMVLPVGYAVAVIPAIAIAAIKFRDPVMHEGLHVLGFLAFAGAATWLLPVVQFRGDDVDPVYGCMYIVALGRLARVWLLPVYVRLIGAVAAIAVGYLLQQWYGVAIAAVGLSISGALGLRHLPNEEFLP